ncbi:MULTISPECIES: SAF domain-containing protein [Streptacidiphilus]|uniref:SAF domain-containing protein n=2 Tax=Streptacidiphilus TaxID=228398 RepID=A0ABV6UUI7_9ACTN|nr:SAF domain-containing protein [Streptacidiphilus jeojiense]
MDTPTGPLTATRPPLAAGAPAPYRIGGARRRRPAVLALAVALIAAGGLGGAALYTATGKRVAVIALARNVPAGQAITSADLTEAHIPLDPALKPISVNSRVVGMRATADLKAGTLLTSGDLTNAPLVQAGQQVVGVATKHTQLPAVKLEPGSRVVLVATPSAAGNASGSNGSAANTLSALTATVVDIGSPDSDGTVVVDLAVPAAQGAAVADLAASGKFALLLAAQGGG